MKPFLPQNIIKVFTILFFLSSSILLTGCWDSKEVNEMALVLGAALDKEEGDNIKLILQILIPRAVTSGQTGGSRGGDSPVLTRSATGKNMADAASKLQTKFPRKIFWGHCKIFIFGKKFAESGNVRKQIDFLLRHPEPRERAYLFVSDGDAEEILKLQPPLEQYPGEALRKLTDLNIGVKTTVVDFDQMLTGDAGTAFLPLIQKLSPTDRKKQEETIANIIGTAIFKRDKMIGQIDNKVTTGLMWLQNGTDMISVTIDPEKDETITLDPVRATTELSPTIRNGHWKILANITSEGTIVQNASNLDVMSPIITRKVEKCLEKEIKQHLNLTLRQVKQEMNADAFGFADAFHRKYPKEWEKVKNHWDEVLPNVEVKINIKARVLRPGLSTTPAGLKEEEVEE